MALRRGKSGEKARSGPCGKGLGAGDEAGLGDQSGADIVNGHELKGAGAFGKRAGDQLMVDDGRAEDDAVERARVEIIPSAVDILTLQ
jgi:hypothetical protein